MGLVLRSLGTLLLGLALILLVIDGTRMLAANAVLTTSLGETVAQLFPRSLEGLQASILTHLHPALWDPTITTILTWPAWLVLGFSGLALGLLGRRRHSQRLVSAPAF